MIVYLSKEICADILPINEVLRRMIFYFPKENCGTFYHFTCKKDVLRRINKLATKKEKQRKTEE